jgi:NADH-quinone oxidoreductase subunit C
MSETNTTATSETTATAFDLISEIKTKIGADLLQYDELDMPTFTIKKEAIVRVLRFLYDESLFSYRFLTTIAGMHFPLKTMTPNWQLVAQAQAVDGKEYLGLMYMVYNMEERRRVRIKAFFPIDEPEVETATGIFSGANWPEREAFDFFGIKFKGHPKLIRILNVEHMTVFPLRKDFPLEDQAREDKNDAMFGR